MLKGCVTKIIKLHVSVYLCLSRNCFMMMVDFLLANVSVSLTLYAWESHQIISHRASWLLGQTNKQSSVFEILVKEFSNQGLDKRLSHLTSTPTMISGLSTQFQNLACLLISYLFLHFQCQPIFLWSSAFNRYVTISCIWDNNYVILTVNDPWYLEKTNTLYSMRFDEINRFSNCWF